MTECFRIAASDNVATLLEDAGTGAATIRGEGEIREIELTQPIKIGHKVALCALQEGATVVKYGVPIGAATRPIAAGEWVHLHNCRSLHDAGSSSLNVETGAREETPYV